MPEPKFPELMDDGSDMDDQNVPGIVNLADEGRTKAAYWQGRAETLEEVIEELKASHSREIAALEADKETLLGEIGTAHNTILGYLKDRLNRFEAKREAE